MKRLFESLRATGYIIDRWLLRLLQSEMFRCGRGRPRGPWRSMADMTSFAYLIGISKKYEIATDKLFDCFLDAWANKKALYKTTSIKCREKTENNAMFLVMHDQKVIAQFRLNNETLRSLREVDFSSFQFADKKVKLKAIALQIKDLNAETKLVNLKATVIAKSIIRMVFSRFGDELLVSTATISDDTGATKLTLWNNQTGTISVGDAVQIENGRVTTFRGELQVSVGKRGKLHVIENKST